MRRAFLWGTDMHDVRAEPSHVQIILHDDEYETPDQFVVELLHAVFKKSVTDATELTEAINTDGHVVCGIYPHEIAQELLAAARKHIQAAGQPLRISSLEDGGRCRCCNTPCGEDSRLSLNGVTALICDVCMHGIAGELPKLTRDKQFEYAHEALAWHFAGIRPDGLTAASRRFPGHMRADVQVAADSLFAECTVRFFGVDDPYHHEALSFAGLTRNDRLAPATAPAQYHEVDIGESAPVRCLDNGVWLCQAERMRLPSCSRRSVNTEAPRGPASKLRCRPAPKAASSCNAVSPRWRTRCVPRAPIAAKSSRWKVMRVTAGSRKASRSTDCRRCSANR